MNKEILTPKCEYLCVIFPKNTGLDTVRFVSSLTSRMIAWIAVSLFSIFPPGNSHNPGRKFLSSLFVIKILFLYSITDTATSYIGIFFRTFGVGYNIGDEDAYALHIFFKGHLLQNVILV